MKKRVAVAGIVLLFLISVMPVQAVSYSLDQTYRILQITAEDFIVQLQEAGASDQEIASFLNELSQKISEQDTLSEDNFDSLMFSAMSGLLQSGSYNNLYIIMVSQFSDAFQAMLLTKQVSAEFQPLYSTVKTCLLGTGELQLFSDVPTGHWAASSIQALAADGIVNGLGNRTFAPEQTVTREEFVKMAVDCLGLDAAETLLPFVDTEEGAWYLPYVSVAYQHQLVSGVDDRSFGVGQPMLRQDMAVMIDRILTKEGITLPSKVTAYDLFEDQAQIDEYARKAVQTLSDGGMIAGVSASSFAPLELVTRAQAARMIHQMRQMLSV